MKTISFQEILDSAKNLSIDEIQKLVGNILGDVDYASIHCANQTFSGLYRARQHNQINGQSDDYIFTNEKEYWNPPKEYINQLNAKKNQPKTTFGPHQDNVLILIKNNPLQDHGSQGEKKLFRYILKLAEAEILYTEKETKPILLLDDFFAKLDDENIMKIFTFFHRKFQAIITTTTTKETTIEKRIKKAKKTKIKTIKLND